MNARIARSPSRRYSLAAVHDASGEMAALTVVAVDPAVPDWGNQLITAVTRPHRGHRLGMLTKAAMMDWLAEAEPAMRRIETWNAASNRYMIAVNEELGYEVWGQPYTVGRAARLVSSSVVETQPPQLLRVALPVLGDLDAQVQVDLRAEERLDLLPGAGADLL